MVARRHIEQDVAKVFEAVVTAQQAEKQATSSGSGADHEEGAAAVGDT